MASEKSSAYMFALLSHLGFESSEGSFFWFFLRDWDLKTVICLLFTTICFLAALYHYYYCEEPNNKVFSILYRKFHIQNEIKRKSAILQQQQNEIAKQRKKKFLLENTNDYGYASIPATFIDNWRLQEFPNLIAPVPITQTSRHWNDICTEETSVSEREVYLDYAGAALPSRSQLSQILENNCTVLANPHSSGPAASRTSRAIEHAKRCILQHFHAEPGRFAGMKSETLPSNANDLDFHCGYDIVFTSGATEACRIVAERFPWSSNSTFAFPQSAHTSVVGMRAPAMGKGATFICQPNMEILVQGIIHAADRSSSKDAQQSTGNGQTNVNSNNLLVFPLECNFTGNCTDARQVTRKINSMNCENRNSKQWLTMLDIAKAASTGPIDLKRLNPDFACVSFYKLFGEPTGLGCLFVKRTSIDTLMGSTTTCSATTSSTTRTTTNVEASICCNNSKCQSSEQKMNQRNSYFGGGSVDVILPLIDFSVRRSEPTPLASLSNGTVHFRGIASLVAGFEELNHRLGGMAVIRRHTTSLAKELVRRLKSLKHANSTAAAIIYGDWNSAGNNGVFANTAITPGPTVAFNIVREDGSFVGYNEVSKLAALNRPPIQLRTGCFCNAGACQLALGLTDSDIIQNYETSGHVCGDQIDIINGRPTGAIRASFGKDSIWEDLDTLVTFIERMFVSKHGSTADPRWDEGPRQVTLKEIYIFPIKSCFAQRVKRWPLASSSGKLLYDREFALVDSSGIAMRLQAYPKMAYIQPVIDLDKHTLTISAPNQRPLVLSLDSESQYLPGESVIKVCGNRCGGVVWGDYEVSTWFSRFLGVTCWLARHCKGSYQLPDSAKVFQIPRPAIRDKQIAFANEQPLLLISEHAVDALNDVLIGRNRGRVTSRHFRPNMVVRLVGLAASRCKSHTEDGWSSVQLSGKQLQFDVVGECARCSMVDVDPTSGMKGNTLSALAEYRRKNGQITFGIFLRSTCSKGQDQKESPDGGYIWVEEGDILSCE